MIILTGRPITKKNSQQFHTNKQSGRRWIAQSDAYQTYETACLWQIRAAHVDAVPGKVTMTARYWMPNLASWPDLFGLIQATADIMEKSGVIANDRDIVRVDGSEIVGIDKEHPRVEIVLRVWGAAQ